MIWFECKCGGISYGLLLRLVFGAILLLLFEFYNEKSEKTACAFVVLALFSAFFVGFLLISKIFMCMGD